MFLGVCIITNVSRPKINDVFVDPAFVYAGKSHAFRIKKTPMLSLEFTHCQFAASAVLENASRIREMSKTICFFSIIAIVLSSSVQRPRFLLFILHRERLMILFGDHRSIKRSTRLDFVDKLFDVVE